MKDKKEPCGANCIGVDKKMAELDALAKSLEAERGFDKSVEGFAMASKLVAEILEQVTAKKGRVLEIIKDTNGIIEKEIKLECIDGEE